MTLVCALPQIKGARDTHAGEGLYKYDSQANQGLLAFEENGLCCNAVQMQRRRRA